MKANIHLYSNFQVALAADPRVSASFLQTLLKENEAQCRQLVTLIQNHLQQIIASSSSSSASARALALLNLLLEITSAVKSDKSTEYDPDTYYGRAPLQWSELFVPNERDHNVNTSSSDSSILVLLLRILMILVHQQLQQQQQQSQTPTIHQINMIETICNILGNLVDDDSTTRVLFKLIPHWSSILLRVWPASSYCCAAIVRQDRTLYGRFFWQSSNLLEQLAQVLLRHDESTKHVEVAWILEGLSRREIETVHAIMTTPLLVPALVQCLATAAGVATDLVVPALRTVQHLATAGSGHYVAALGTMEHLIPTVCRLLETTSTSTIVTTEAIRAASVLMRDTVGPPRQAQKTASLAHFVPRLVTLLLHPQSRREIRCEAVCAIRDALVGDATRSNNSNKWTNHDLDDPDDIAQHQAERESHLLAQLRYFVWTSTSATSSSSTYPGISNRGNDNDDDGDDQSHQDQLMQALVDLLRHSNNNTEDVTEAVLQILDPLMRNIESSRYLFQSHGGVDALQEGVCSTLQLRYSESQRLAERLLDEVLDQDEEEDEEYDDQTLAAVTIMNNPFAFGSGGGPDADVVRAGLSVLDQPQRQNLPATGRGRGRTLPAWMVQESSKQWQ